MKLKIVLDDEDFHCLKQSIPTGSRSKFIIENARRLGFSGSNVVVSCDEAEARILLLYAGHFPNIAASIHKALGLAGLLLDPVNGRE